MNRPKAFFGSLKNFYSFIIVYFLHALLLVCVLQLYLTNEFLTQLLAIVAGYSSLRLPFNNIVFIQIYISVYIYKG